MQYLQKKNALFNAVRIYYIKKSIKKRGGICGYEKKVVSLQHLSALYQVEQRNIFFKDITIRNDKHYNFN